MVKLNWTDISAVCSVREQEFEASSRCKRQWLSVTGCRSTVMAAVVTQTGAKAGRRKSKEFSPLVKKPQVFFTHRSAQYSNKIMISQFCLSLKINSHCYKVAPEQCGEISFFFFFAANGIKATHSKHFWKKNIYTPKKNLRRIISKLSFATRAQV